MPLDGTRPAQAILSRHSPLHYAAPRRIHTCGYPGDLLGPVRDMRALDVTWESQCTFLHIGCPPRSFCIRLLATTHAVLPRLHLSARLTDTATDKVTHVVMKWLPQLHEGACSALEAAALVRRIGCASGRPQKFSTPRCHTRTAFATALRGRLNLTMPAKVQLVQRPVWGNAYGASIRQKATPAPAANRQLMSPARSRANIIRALTQDAAFRVLASPAASSCRMPGSGPIVQVAAHRAPRSMALLHLQYLSGVVHGCSNCQSPY
jgi:hypothetical protein